jgi:hypothetical protein
MRGCRAETARTATHRNTFPRSIDDSNVRKSFLMRYFVLVLALVGAATAARAQDATPDIKGTWVGKGKVAVFGSNTHNPGTQTMAEPPRMRDIEMTDVVEGQDGRLAWGRSSSAVMDSKEPFAWAISSDNKSVVGADMDGYFHITLLGPPTAWKSATSTME